MNDEEARRIRLSGHAQGYLQRRGFTEAEVIETIRQGSWAKARGGRLEATMDFAYNDVWNGTYYATKRVRPIFVEEPDEIVVVTVYTYFF
jgi:Domain of unknown function (DUF4258)